MTELAGDLEQLVSMVQPDGGWSYRTGQASHLEPTCLALLALGIDRNRFEGAIDRGLAYLETCAAADGSYRLPAGRSEATWPTALVLFVQAALGVAEPRIQRTASRLLELKGVVKEIPAEEVSAIGIDIDLKLVGWSWSEGNFSWVEPTAWACLALRRAGYGNHTRVQQGIELLLDRAFDEGGINYGNRRAFGKMTEPIVGPTALMLLALQREADRPRVAAAVKYLQEQIASLEDLENLCWIKIALDVHGAANCGAGERILQARTTRESLTWSRPSPYREALAILAMAGPDQTPFRSPAGNSSERSIIPLPRPRGGSFRDRINAFFQRVIVQAAGNLRPVAASSPVHVAPVADYQADIADVLRRQYDHFRGQVPLAGKRVVLKPNLVEYRPNQVINTHPHVVAAAIELCKREGAAEVIVAEGPGHWRNVDIMVQASGLAQVLKHHGVRFVDLNHDDVVQVVNMGRCTGLEHLWLPRTVHAADVLISLAKLKTHHWAGVTLSLKNLFGIMPGICYGWPKNELHWRGIDQSIIDIALTRTPDLAIVDGIVGMEGDGPINGTPRPLGVMVMGADPLAVDATCCRLMKIDPARVGYLMLGHRKKLGHLAESNIVQLGEPIHKVARPFATFPERFAPLRMA